MYCVNEDMFKREVSAEMTTDILERKRRICMHAYIGKTKKKLCVLCYTIYSHVYYIYVVLTQIKFRRVGARPGDYFYS